jgi:hypothetical protein
MMLSNNLPNYFHRLLTDGNQPFRYRSRLRALLGVPPLEYQPMANVTMPSLVGFHYLTNIPTLVGEPDEWSPAMNPPATSLFGDELGKNTEQPTTTFLGTQPSHSEIFPQKETGVVQPVATTVITMPRPSQRRLSPVIPENLDKPVRKTAASVAQKVGSQNDKELGKNKSSLAPLWQRGELPTLVKGGKGDFKARHSDSLEAQPVHADVVQPQQHAKAPTTPVTIIDMPLPANALRQAKASSQQSSLGQEPSTITTPKITPTHQKKTKSLYPESLGVQPTSIITQRKADVANVTQSHSKAPTLIPVATMVTSKPSQPVNRVESSQPSYSTTKLPTLGEISSANETNQSQATLLVQHKTAEANLIRLLLGQKTAKFSINRREELVSDNLLTRNSISNPSLSNTLTSQPPAAQVSKATQQYLQPLTKLKREITHSSENLHQLRQQETQTVARLKQLEQQLQTKASVFDTDKNKSDTPTRKASPHLPKSSSLSDKLSGQRQGYPRYAFWERSYLSRMHLQLFR